jgi:hypothetical protein
MDLVITTHAQQRMEQRGITRDDIERALQRPAGSPRPGRQPNTLGKIGYTGGDKPLKVVVSASDQRVVVTVYWSAP